MVVILEPRISGVMVDDVVKRISFDRSHSVEANGFVGGIWIM